MRKFVFVIGAAMLLTVVAAASEQSDMMAPVHQFVNGFNKNDVKMTVGACAGQTAIIDEFAPYHWSGCSAWINAYHAWAKQNGITDGIVTFGEARRNEVVGDQAYVVVPAEFAFKQNGKPMKEAGATLTVVLHKGASGWRITAWTWSHP